MHIPARSRPLARWGGAFVLGMSVASAAWWAGSGASLSAQSGTTVGGVPEQIVRPARDLSDAFIAIAAATTPAVVSIETRRPARASDAEQPELPEQFWRFFDFDPDRGDPDPEFSGGTGFIVRADGHILTNAHVVSGADRITVTLHDRRTVPARLVGADPTTDVAVIKIDDAGDLPVLPLGDSDAVRVGEWVIAIGNPGFGGASQLDYTVTAGIVSALGRPLQLLNRQLRQDPRFESLALSAIENFLQTDAVINPGNSGGPMIDLGGRVIGLNSAIASESGFYQGYGFAVPVNLARRVMDDLIRFGEVRRPVLGVEIATVAPEDAEYYRLPSVAGVLIQRVPEDGPARRAGLEPGDVVVAIDGESVATVGELQQTIAEHRPGQEVAVTYYRSGDRRETRVTLGENTIGAPGAATPGDVEPPTSSVLGMEVQNLDAALASRLGFDRPGGVVVVGVDPYGPAGRRGVGPNVRIVEINDEEIDEAEDVQEILRSLTPGSIASLEVEDASGARRIVNVRVPE